MLPSSQVPWPAPLRTPEVERRLAGLREAAAKDGENLMPYLVDCCHAYATVGEMCDALREVWGEYEEVPLI